MENKAGKLAQDRNLNASLIDDRDVNLSYSNIVSTINIAATASIPQSSGKRKNHKLAYWCPEIKKAIAARKKTFNLWSKTRLLSHWIAYKQAKALAQQVMRAQVKTRWQEFCTPTKPIKVSKVWSTIRAMQNQSLSRFVPNLVVGGASIVETKDKATAFAKHFASVSNDANYDEPFASLKIFMEMNTARLLTKNESTGNGDVINTVFTYLELQRAIASVRPNTAPGPDKIPNSMIK